MGGSAELEGVMAKKDEEIKNLQDMMHEMEVKVQALKKENVVYEKIYGEAPKVEEKEDGHMVILQDDGHGHIEEVAIQEVNMKERVMVAEDRVVAMQGEVEAIAKE